MSNSIVARHRERFPTDNRSDEELTLLYGDQLSGRSGQLPQDFLDDLKGLQRRLEVATRPSLTTEFKQAFGRGVDTAQAQLYDTLALGADKIGLESVGRFADRKRQEQLAEVSTTRKSVNSVEEIETFDDFAHWFAGIVGENAPQLGATIGATAAGGLAGGPPGAIAAGAAAGFTQTQNYGDLRDDGVDPQTASNTAITTGFLSSLLEVLPVFKALRPITKEVGKEVVQKTALDLLKRIPENALLEGSTEAGQEFIAMVGEVSAKRKADPDYEITDNEFVSRLVNAGAAGMALGGGLGVVEAGGEAIRNRSVPAKPGDEEVAAAFSPNLPEEERAIASGIAERSQGEGISVEEASWLAANPERRTWFVSNGGNAENVRAPQPVAQPAPQPPAPTVPQPQPSLDDRTRQFLEFERRQQQDAATLNQASVALQEQRRREDLAARTEQFRKLDRYAQREREDTGRLVRATQELLDRRRQEEEAKRKQQLPAVYVRPELRKQVPVAPRPTTPQPPVSVPDDAVASVVATPYDSTVFENPSEVRKIANKVKAREELTPQETALLQSFSRIQQEQFVNLVTRIAPPKQKESGLDVRTLDKSTTVRKQGVGKGEQAVEGTRLRGFTMFPLNTAFTLRNGRKVTDLDHTTYSPELDEILADDSSKGSKDDKASMTRRYVFFEDTSDVEPSRKVIALPVYKRTYNGKRQGRVTRPGDVAGSAQAKSVTVQQLMGLKSGGAQRFVPLAVRNAHEFVDGNDSASIQYFSKDEFYNLAKEELSQIAAMQRGAEQAKFQSRGFDDQGNVIEGRTVTIASGLDPRDASASTASSVDPVVTLSDTITEILGENAGPDLSINEVLELMEEYRESGPEEAASLKEIFREVVNELTSVPGFRTLLGESERLAASQPEKAAAMAAEIQKKTKYATAELIRQAGSSGDIEGFLSGYYGDAGGGASSSQAVGEGDAGRALGGDGYSNTSTTPEESGLTNPNLGVTPDYQGSRFPKSLPSEPDSGSATGIAVVDSQDRPGHPLEPKLKFSIPTDGGPRVSGPRLIQTYAQVLRNAARANIDVRLFQRRLDELAGEFFQREGGSFDNASNTITLVLRDLQAPSLSDFMVALHEIAHHILRNEPQQVRDTLMAAIGNAVDGRLKIDPDANLSTSTLDPEEILVETAAQSINPDQARSLIRQILDFMRQVYVRVAMAYQSALRGRENVDPAFAEEYVTLKLRRFVDGGVPTTIANWFGGGRPRHENKVEYFTPTSEGWLKSRYNTRTRRMEIATVVPFTAEEAIMNLEAAKFSIPTDTTISPDIGTSQAVPMVAASRYVDAVLKEAFSNFENSGGNRTADGKPLSDYQGFLSRILPRKTDAPLAVVEAINGKLQKLGIPPVNEQVVLDRLQEFPKKDAARKALILLRKIHQSLGESVAKGVAEEERITNAMDIRTHRLDKLVERHADAEAITAHIIEETRSLFDRIRGDLKAFRTSTNRISKGSQMIGELDAKLDEPGVADEYVKAVDHVFNHLTGSGKARIALFDMMDLLVSQGFDWSQVSASSVRRLIKDAGRRIPELSRLAAGDKTANVLATALVHFLQKHSHVAGLMSLRKENLGKQRDTLIKSLREAIKGDHAALKRAETIIRSLPRASANSTRILVKIEELQQQQRVANRRIQSIRSLRSIAEANADHLRHSQDRLEAILGAQDIEFEAVEGNTYRVPDSKGGWVEKRFRYARNKKELAALGKDLKAMSDWLSSIPVEDPRRGAAEYNRIRSQYDKILSNSVIVKDLPNRDSFAIRFAGSLADKLDLVNHPAAQSASRRIRKYSAFVSANKEKTFRAQGVKWAALEADTMRAVGMNGRSPEEFRRVFYNRAFHFFARHKHLLSEYAPKDAQREAMTLLRKHYRNDPVASKIVVNDSAWNALKRYWTYTAEVSNSLVKKAEENGLKVDDRDKLGLYRSTIGAPLFEVMREPSSLLASLFDRMKGEWVDFPLAKSRSGELVAFKGLEGLDAQVQQYFTNGVWGDFVGELANGSARSAFYGPKAADGTRDLLSVTHVRAAYDVSNGSISRFIAALHQAGRDETTTESVEDYAVEILSELGEWFDVIRGMNADRAESTDKPLTAGQPLMNARVSDTLPEGWVSHRTYDVRDMASLLHTMGYNIAFGRNLEAIKREMAIAIRELETAVDRHTSDVVQKAQATGKKGKALREEMVRLAGGQAAFDRGQKALKDLKLANEQRHAFESFIESAHHSVDWGIANEAVSTAVAGAVQGLKTALVDTTSAFKPLMEYGFSIPSLMMSLDIMRNIGKSVGNSTANALPGHVAEGDRFNRELSDIAIEAGFVDSDRFLTMKESLNGEMHSVPSADGSSRAGAVGEAVRKALRTGRSAISVGAGRGESASPTLKFAAPFTFISKTINLAAIQGAFRLYGNLTAKMVRLFQENPNWLNDPDFEFTPEQLGFRNHLFGILRDKDSYLYMRQRFEDELGMTLENAARDAIRRNAGQTLKSLFEPYQWQRIGNIAMTDIVQESSATTTPSAFLSNPGLHAMLPLLNWSIRQSVSVAKAFSTPGGGRWDADAMRKGFLGIASLIPIGLAYSALVDEFEEEVMGKKANVLGFGGNPFLAMVDRLSRVGTFGIAGDAFNSMVNLDTSRPFSIDSRVFAISSITSMMQTVGTGIQQGAYSWETVGRPLAMSLGGAGYLANFQIINNLLSLDNEEARVNGRINVNNQLRAAGREVGLEVRTYRGGAVVPSKTRPHVKGMLLAAYANDMDAFMKAYARAVAAARKDGKENPKESVKRSFQGYHPLRSVFRTSPTDDDINKLLSVMSDTGREDVMEAVSLVNQYSEFLGIKGFTGKQERRSAPLSAYLTSGF